MFAAVTGFPASSPVLCSAERFIPPTAGALAEVLTAHSFRIRSASEDPPLHRRASLFRATALCTGGKMLLKFGLVLLAAWLLGMLGVYRLGQNVHFLLLVGLMLLLLGFLKARDAAGKAS